MYEIISELEGSPVVSHIEIRTIVDEPDIQVIYLRVSLVDGSVLYVRETITPAFDSYSYHWQTADRQLIRRWDNAPHWPEIPTFPHHCHVGQEDNVQPSEHPTISDVMAYITNMLMQKKEE